MVLTDHLFIYPPAMNVPSTKNEPAKQLCLARVRILRWLKGDRRLSTPLTSVLL